MKKETEYLLELHDVSKCYGEKQVVKHLNFGIQKGEILGFLGPNGAGKSTTIRMITGVERMSQGEIYFKNKENEQNRDQFLKAIGVVPQEIAVYMDMNAYENVHFFCSLYGFKGEELDKRTKDALEFVGLWECRKEKPLKFSGGMKRRLNIACAIAHTPELLIMDEPKVGVANK